MTANQIAILNYREGLRHNLMDERIRQDTLKETKRSNIATLEERDKHNTQTRFLTQIRDSGQINYWAGQLDENRRHNLAQEYLSKYSTDISSETSRRNVDVNRQTSLDTANISARTQLSTANISAAASRYASELSSQASRYSADQHYSSSIYATDRSHELDDAKRVNIQAQSDNYAAQSYRTKLEGDYIPAYYDARANEVATKILYGWIPLAGK